MSGRQSFSGAPYGSGVWLTVITSGLIILALVVSSLWWLAVSFLDFALVSLAVSALFVMAIFILYDSRHIRTIEVDDFGVRFKKAETAIWDFPWNEVLAIGSYGGNPEDMSSAIFVYAGRRKHWIRIQMYIMPRDTLRLAFRAMCERCRPDIAFSDDLHWADDLAPRFVRPGLQPFNRDGTEIVRQKAVSRK